MEIMPHDSITWWNCTRLLNDIPRNVIAPLTASIDIVSSGSLITGNAWTSEDPMSLINTLKYVC